MSAPDTVLDAFEAGYAVVPADMNKRAKVEWKAWQTERQTVEEFDALGHGSVWGLVTGELAGVVVLDFDEEHGGMTTLADLDLEPHVRTPSGAHVYVKHPGHRVKNSVRKYEDEGFVGMDIRGDGGLAWFAGRSRKGTYEPLVWPPEPIELPEEMAEILFPLHEVTERAAFGEWTGPGHGRPEAVRYVTKLAERIRDAEPGTSNAELNKAGYAAGGLISSGQLEDTWAYDTLLSAAVDRGAGEPAAVLEAAMASGREEPWGFTTETDEYIPIATALAFGRQASVPEPTPFPIDALPSPLDDFTRQAAKAVSAPPDYIGAGILPVLGLGLGGYVSLRITDSWKESPLLYTALVGPPSARKSPSLGLILDPVYAAEEAMAGDEDDWVELDAPALIADDATIEAFFGVLEKNPRGVILAADEITGWVNGMGQYKGGAGRDRQHWLSIWSRKPIKVARKTTKSHRIPKPFAAVLGGIQPEPLEELIQGRDDGLLPRILLAQGERVTPFLDRTVKTVAAAGQYAETWNRLRDFGMTERVVEFSDAGYAAYERWVNQDHYPTLQRVPGELAGAWGKMDAQAARLSLILSMVMGEETVSADAVDRAIALVRYFQGQAAGLLQGTGSGSRWEKQQRARNQALGRYLIENPGADRADIMLAFDWAMDARSLDRALDTMADLGLW